MRLMLPAIPDETPIDPSHLLLKHWDGSRRSLNEAEARNIAKAAIQYLDGPITSVEAPFTFDWMLDLHRDMFDQVWGRAGKIRTENLNLGSDFYHAGAHLLELSLDISYWVATPENLIEDAVTIHHRAVKIHPFPNGNGRWSRMLANIWLWRHGWLPTEWPTEIQDVGTIRAEYIAAIKDADRGNRRPLVALHRRYTPAP